MYCCQHILAVYPPTSRALRSSIGLHDIAPHRVYPISLQHDLYILSVALFLASRLVAVSHYVALWCSDFPPHAGHGAIRRFTCVQNYINC